MTKIAGINIKVDRDHTVTGAWEADGPIYLVKFESKDGKVFRSRFDLHKEIFIDPFSVKVGPNKIKQLVEFLSSGSRISPKGTRSKIQPRSAGPKISRQPIGLKISTKNKPARVRQPSIGKHIG